MRSWLARYARKTRDRGASAVEYGLLVAAIAAVLAGTVFAVGGLVKGAFDRACSGLSDPQGLTCMQGNVVPKLPNPPGDVQPGGVGATQPTDLPANG